MLEPGGAGEDRRADVVEVMEIADGVQGLGFAGTDGAARRAAVHGAGRAS